jgi:hypothetical protein
VATPSQDVLMRARFQSLFGYELGLQRFDGGYRQLLDFRP